MHTHETNLSAAREFTLHLADLLRSERDAMVRFLLALVEFDGRRLWVQLGYASLFDFLHRELRLSRSAAYYRNAAVTLVHRYPEVADALAEGKLCLSSLGEVSKVITEENASAILPRFFHLSAREAKEVAAAIAPHPAPPVREVVTAVRSPEAPRDPGATIPAVLPAVQTSGLQIDLNPTAAAVPEIGRAISLESAFGPDEARRSSPVATSSSAGTTVPAAEHGSEVQPLTGELFRLHLTVTRRWLEKLQRVREALSHSHPDGHSDELIDAAFDLLLERAARRKGLVKKPRSSVERSALSEGPTPVSVPKRRAVILAAVKRTVYQRDQGCCQARLHDGTTCGARVRVQLDHRIPDALGGPATVDNLQLRCERHNQLAAREVFGETVMELFARRGA